MASLKDISRRIRSVNNTQKTTKAMKLVSTVKLKRAEEVATRSRPYAQKPNSVISDIACRIYYGRKDGVDSSRFFMPLEPREVRKADLIFVTADKGLCGGFNSQTLKAVSEKLNNYSSNNTEVRLRGIGKKGIAFFKFNKIELHDVAVGLSASPDYEKAKKFVAKSVSDFLDGYIDEVVLIYNGYKNMISQELREIRLLPVDFSSRSECDLSSQIEFEPANDYAILEAMLQRYIDYNLYFALVDSLAGEHSARMQAMENATNNANDLVASLSLSYNKARQEAITTELTEIVSGAELMK